MFFAFIHFNAGINDAGLLRNGTSFVRMLLILLLIKQLESGDICNCKPHRLNHGVNIRQNRETADAKCITIRLVQEGHKRAKVLIVNFLIVNC